jgi:hypothetical protein
LLWINLLIAAAQRRRSGVLLGYRQKDRRGCVEELNKALLCSTVESNEDLIRPSLRQPKYSLRN